MINIDNEISHCIDDLNWRRVSVQNSANVTRYNKGWKGRRIQRPKLNNFINPNKHNNNDTKFLFQNLTEMIAYFKI